MTNLCDNCIYDTLCVDEFKDMHMNECSYYDSSDDTGCVEYLCSLKQNIIDYYKEMVFGNDE